MTSVYQIIAGRGEITIYDDYRDAYDDWPIPNFSPDELRCRGTGILICHWDSLQRLQRLRDKLGVPLVINSAGRSYEHNKDVGGAPQSQHLAGRAFDVLLSDLIERDELVKEARRCGFRGIGHYNTFVHIDTRQRPGSWDMRT